jgi:hypothetical protein
MTPELEELLAEPGNALRIVNGGREFLDLVKAVAVDEGLTVTDEQVHELFVRAWDVLQED